MSNHNLALVSGANGHLGNNLVRLLLKKGIPVRASVRNIKNKKPFKGLNCEVVQADITDKASFVKALQGVETFYAVGASFKLWAKNPEKEIYDVNIEGTRNTIEAAVEAGVKHIVYHSCGDYAILRNLNGKPCFTYKDIAMRFSGFTADFRPSPKAEPTWALILKKTKKQVLKESFAYLNGA
ncbi:hypothetical protein FQR65_LT17986 [Abscondita terminalis]|nr:hypothetical protein FQR65_LT17986 [Abscondita terminalis]